MLDLKNRYPIGIDIMDRNIYAAQFQVSREGLLIRELFHRELDNGHMDSAETDDALFSVLKEIAKNKRFRGKSVSICPPYRHIYSFPITFENDSNETIEEGMIRECRKHLSFPLEEAVIDYPSIIDVSSGENKRFKAIIIAIKRSQVEAYIHLAKRAGLWLERIDFDLSSLLRLHNHLYVMRDDPLIICNIGYNHSLIAVASKNTIFAQRNTAWGIQHLLNRLEINLELSDNGNQTLGMLKNYGLYYAHQKDSDGTVLLEKRGDNDDAKEVYRSVFQIIAPYVDELIHEFYQVTGYIRSEIERVKFEKVFLYGYGNSINYLDQYLEKTLNIPTECINPMMKFTLSDDSQLPDKSAGAPFALAIGLAMGKVTWL